MRKPPANKIRSLFLVIGLCLCVGCGLVLSGIVSSHTDSRSELLVGGTPTATPTATATPCGSDKIYNVGGTASIFGHIITSTNRVYEIPTNTWSTRAPLPNPIAEHAIAYLNGKIYVAGGRNNTGWVNTLFIYDIANDSWTPGASTVRVITSPAGVPKRQINSAIS